ncbi:RNA ligase family protein [Laceyella putida]|uniref:RNA ligase family protein n=1 Tax=Laceyella putida TaxID=110101 RepID=A0ABW2RHE9_9BACL
MLFTPLKPMLLTIHLHVDLEDPRYVYQCKMDGYRALLHKGGDRIEIYTRHGNKVTEKFPEIVKAARQMKADEAILDGELVVFSDQRPVFDHVRNRGLLSDPGSIQQAVKKYPATFAAFDVLYINGNEHLKEPLLERLNRLEDLINPSNSLITVPHFEDGQSLYDWTQKHHWEGLVCKEKNSRYHLNARSGEWIKVKHWRTLDCVILGYKLKPFGMVVGAHFKTVENKPLALVERGFHPEEIEAFLAVAGQIHTWKDRTGIQWIEPRLCCKVKYLDRTENHQLRMVQFEHFLIDHHPAACQWVS